ncbi:sarcosine oxidase subunit gamma family protein [Sulfitobacter sp. HNIBRBA3233]|uniref:sarcosine oxidase subunit gamma n=1 Tax=Sulfitobacter marinivivus TaxID=3158558 RepID=UPI0032DEB767
MSDPVAPMNNARFDTGIATVSEVIPTGMITLRGDISARKIQKIATHAAGVAMPGTRQITTDGDAALAWMSPDELLVMCPYAEAGQRVADMQKALGGEHALVVNVSDARAIFDVSGPRAREVIAKLAPVDLAPAQFGPGEIRRTRLAQVPAAFWMVSQDSFRVVCFRSVAQYVFNLLKTAAQTGSEVDAF